VLLARSGAGEEVMAATAWLWAEVPVRVDWAAVSAQCAWAGQQARAFLVVPAVRLLVLLSLAMTVMILLEKLFVAAVCYAAKAFGHRPESRYQWRPIAASACKTGGGNKEDGIVIVGSGSGSAAFPVVLVQIPMYNEREVYKVSIGAACALEWPSDRMVIQVLDDSTDPVVKELVKTECQRWKGKGVNIRYEVRGNRKGYKAGALKQGLMRDYVRECKFIAMFDADFQPESDFLLRTVPFLVHNPDIALVQTRWKFVNSDKCLLTRFQEMSLDYHFKFEQEAGSIVYSFFGFNGTAGVWRISAINDAGGWEDRTTVEDMDLAVRTALLGWKFVYVGAVKIAAHTVTFIYYCFAIPVSVFFPEIQIPLWGVVYVPTVITLCKALGSPSSFHLVILWVLFDNVMSLHRIKATITGLLDTRRVNEWVVTEKLGDANKTEPAMEGLDDVQVIDVELSTPLVPKLEKRRTRLWDKY
uniref:glucomannan 4-beta-mannosyltransferase n=1 Tax=Aegilops tauschii subsp. strangulata TaxID=200361 RepID=A0A453DQ17_AEGTS